MNSLMFVILILGALCIGTSFAQGSCEIKTSSSGKIADTQRLRRFNQVEKCWIIRVPANSKAFIEVTKLTLDRPDFTDVKLTVGKHTLKPQLVTKFEISGSTDTKVTFFVKNIRNAYEMKAEFELNYKIAGAEGTTASPTSATESITRPPTGDTGCTVRAKDRNRTLQLLNSHSHRIGGWRDNTSRVMTAIHLANGTNFAETCDQKIIAKDLELGILSALGSGRDSIKELVTYINALVAICVDPKKFHGQDLLVALKEKIQDPNNDGFDDSAAYLAKCISGEQLSQEQLEQMTSEFLFKVQTKQDLTIRFYAAMTIACADRRGYDTDTEDFDRVFKEIMDDQRTDGSFDRDVYTTAMYVQIFMANNVTDDLRWSFENAVEYLTKAVEKSEELDELLFTLPVLGCKTMADIRCNDPNRRKGIDEFTMTDVKELIMRYKVEDSTNKEDEIKSKIS